ncbi:membrane protein [Kitasatospora phosalacinea]|uniref:Membrane protein n=1 Tax=Kitasatospora phosalacinea TaxID=2065 RepID=A0A9W6PN25_9ACTN|nr:membrane protein [Kitasatospora phosalacinea]GLW57742.1 membrane protein [Kitasatospora phosalacinea]
MAKFLLSLHLLVVALCIGPVAVAVSMFPRRARAALAAGPEQPAAQASVRLLHRISNVYALIGLGVPLLGIGTAQAMGVLGNAWLVTSIVLTAAAAGVLLLFVLPGQQATVDALDATEDQDAETARATGKLKMLPMTAGVFNLLWAVVLVLMVIRPGSTNGA